MTSNKEALATYLSTIASPSKLRLFVAVTMDCGLDRSQFGISGPRRIRKKKLVRLFKRAAFETLIACIKEEQADGAAALPAGS